MAIHKGVWFSILQIYVGVCSFLGTLVEKGWVKVYKDLSIRFAPTVLHICVDCI